MSDFDLIAFDLDGTLLDSRLRVLPENYAAIERVRAAGKQAAICTGRCYSEIAYVADALPPIRYAICANGGCVYDLVRREALCYEPLDPALISEILDIARGERVVRHVFSHNQAYFDNPDLSFIDEFSLGEYRETFSHSSQCRPGMLDGYREKPFQVEKLNLYFSNADDRARIRAKLKPLGVHLVDSLCFLLECNAPAATKANGLTRLGEILGIPTSRMIFAGDGENDVEALRLAGLGVAMGNAVDCAKAAADIVTTDCDHPGLAEVMEKWLL